MISYENTKVETGDELRAERDRLSGALSDALAAFDRLTEEARALRAEIRELRAIATGGVDEVHRSIEQRQAELLKAEIARHA